MSFKTAPKRAGVSTDKLWNESQNHLRLQSSVWLLVGSKCNIHYSSVWRLGRNLILYQILALDFGLELQVAHGFWKFALYHFAFTKDLHEYLFSLTERNPKRVFAFIRKSESGNSVQPLFCRNLLRGSATPAETVAPKLLPKELHSGSQRQAAVALNCVY